MSKFDKEFGETNLFSVTMRFIRMRSIIYNIHNSTRLILITGVYSYTQSITPIQHWAGAYNLVSSSF